MKLSPMVLLLLAALLAACGPDRAPDLNSIVGVWKVVAIDIVQASTQGANSAPGQIMPNSDPLPSQFIFTNRHYSAVWMPGNDPIEAFSVRWQPSDDEKIRRFGEVTVNTGTYEVTGGQLKVRPAIARVPEFMGGSMTYDYEWSGDRLVLTFVDELTFDGIQAPWVGESSGRIQLTLARLDD